MVASAAWMASRVRNMVTPIQEKTLAARNRTPPARAHPAGSVAQSPPRRIRAVSASELPLLAWLGSGHPGLFDREHLTERVWLYDICFRIRQSRARAASIRLRFRTWPTSPCARGCDSTEAWLTNGIPAAGVLSRLACNGSGLIGEARSVNQMKTRPAPSTRWPMLGGWSDHHRAVALDEIHEFL